MGQAETTEHGRPILIVDDDVDIREALAETLEDRGFEVITASGGVDALRLLRTMKGSPSAILLDLMMPVMDGYGFLAEQGRDPALARIPVAIITAGHGVDHSRLGDSPPIIRKPIKVQQLVDILRQLQSSGGTTT